MTEGQSRTFDRGTAADLWRHTLAEIPTVFGRLAYLASLRNPNSGAYEHFGLAQVFGEEEAGRTLQECHLSVFADWLRFPLERQKREVTEYLESLEEPPAKAIASWIALAPYRNYMPVEAREGERRLYLADLETVLELLRIEYGVACPDPDA